MYYGGGSSGKPEVMTWREMMMRAYQTAADHEGVVVQEHPSGGVELIDAEGL